ncbi:hypothetical protein Tco_0105757 [Tanacetum coccineum]
MLKKGSYVQWSSYNYGKKEYDGNPPIPPFKRIQEEADLKGDDKKRFEAFIDAMNAILLGLSNEIYNFVNACKTAQAMWQ